MGGGARVRRVLVFVGLAAVPLFLLATGLRIGLEDGSLAWDFHHELYPQAEQMLAGRNPYPSPGFEPAEGNNFVFPAAAAFLISPLTVLPLTAADVAIALLGLGCLALALWIVGARDWRVYGVVGLWPPVFIESGLAHLTPAIALLMALTWRERDARYAGGVYAGLAVALKFFAWPLGVWLAARRRASPVVVGALVASGSLLLILPYTGLDDYVRALRAVNSTFDQDTYTIFGLFSQAGFSDPLSRLAAFVLVAALVWGTWRFRSFTLAVATALAASPIVWLDYFALAAVPLAVARPRLSAIWFVPLVTAGLEGAGLGIGDPLGSLRVLGAFATVFAVAFHAERLSPSTEARRQGSFPTSRPPTDTSQLTVASAREPKRPRRRQSSAARLANRNGTSSDR